MILFEKVAVIGAGLLGSSLAWALRKRRMCASVSAWSRSASTREKCAAAPWCDEVCETPAAAVCGADLAVFAAPAPAIPGLARETAPFMKPGALATDVGSTKASIARGCAEAFAESPAHFVPSHPMAGSEKSGPENADPDLFERAACFVCAPGDSPHAQKIAQMWEGVGMRVEFTDPETHDRIAAAISHIPQCAASALAVLALENPEWFEKFAGNGFRDTTRIAKSDTGMWLGIFSENAENISAGLREYARKIMELSDAIARRDAASQAAFLDAARGMRLRLDTPETRPEGRLQAAKGAENQTGKPHI